MYSPTDSGSQPTTPAVRSTQRVHLDGLDGIRGLTALYVTLFHAQNNAGYKDSLLAGPLSAPMRLVSSVINYGTYAVPVFIVLSGFCLMLPLAQRDTLALPGGTATFLKRRSWRILPSYYMALLLSLALIAALPVLQLPHNTAWDNKIPVTTDAVISHLLMVHNFNQDWLFKINGPLWSIPIEWQIYFLFPVLLLLWRRTTMGITVGAALVVSVLPHFLLPDALSIDYSHPWFLGLFALGMAGAAIARSRRPTETFLRERVPWPWIAGIIGFAMLAGMTVAKIWMDWHTYLTEPVLGLAITAFLIWYGAVGSEHGRSSLVRRLLESRALVGLGAFSYSLYLIHYPILSLINLATLSLPLSADLRLLLQVAVATPLSMAVAYIFYLLVERRSMQARERLAPGATTQAPTTH
jgi:peptidoglycan/LPS O-acetylase OafA/YrhL